MAPPAQGGGASLDPNSVLAKKINESFGSFEEFQTKFSDVAGGHFASGWAWLVLEKSSGKVKIVDTHDAGTVLTQPDLVPLLTCDVWEHAYYIDYRNARPDYIKAWWKLVNWKFAQDNLQKAQ